MFACTPTALNRAPPPSALGEISMLNLLPCEPLQPDAGSTAGDAYVARAGNDGRYTGCQDRHAALAGIVWEAIRRRHIDLKEQP